MFAAIVVQEVHWRILSDVIVAAVCTSILTIMVDARHAGRDVSKSCILVCIIDKIFGGVAHSVSGEPEQEDDKTVERTGGGSF